MRTVELYCHIYTRSAISSLVSLIAYRQHLRFTDGDLVFQGDNVTFNTLIFHFLLDHFLMPFRSHFHTFLSVHALKRVILDSITISKPY